MNEHLSDSDLESYVTHSVSGQRVTEIWQHLAGCEECKARVAAAHPDPAGAVLSALRREPSWTKPHPAYAALAAYVDKADSGDARSETERHLLQCAQCRSEISGLQRVQMELRDTPVKLGGADKSAAAARPAALPHLRWAYGSAGILMAAFLVAIFFYPAAHRSVQPALAPSRPLEIAPQFQPLSGSLAAKENATLGTTESLQSKAIRYTTDQPVLHWRTVPEAQFYQVEIRTARNQVARSSPLLRANTWKVEPALRFGTMYYWNVTSYRRGHQTIRRAERRGALIIENRH